MVKDIIFENISINGEKMRDLKEFVINEFVANVKVQ